MGEGRAFQGFFFALVALSLREKVRVRELRIALAGSRNIALAESGTKITTTITLTMTASEIPDACCGEVTVSTLTTVLLHRDGQSLTLS
jgi:hypothetical protein